MSERVGKWVIIAFIVVGSMSMLSGCPQPDPSPNFPPGSNATGVNATLADTHASELETATSFMYEVTTYRFINGQYRRVTFNLSANISANRYRSATQLGEIKIETYYVNGTLYRKQIANGTVEYEIVRNVSSPVDRVQRITSTIEVLVSTANFSYKGRETGSDGETVFVYTATGVNASALTAVPSTNISATLMVAPDGFVKVTTIIYQPSVESLPNRVQTEARFISVNETIVAKPGWIENNTRSARNQQLTESLQVRSDE